MCVHWGQPSGSASTCKVSPSSGLPLLNGKTNQPIYYEDAPVSCRLCLMMGGGVLIKICSKAVRSHLHFWWSWWWWWWWQWWRTLSHIDAQKPIYGIKCLWEFGCTPWWGGGEGGRTSLVVGWCCSWATINCAALPCHEELGRVCLTSSLRAPPWHRLMFKTPDYRVTWC